MKNKPYKGQDFSKCEVLTVPDQAMSLREIIERFVRGESVDAEFPVQWHESEDDLEKLRYLDPVDKQAYIKKMMEVQERYNEQEEKKRIAMEEKARAEFLEKLEKEHKIKQKEAAAADTAK